MGQRHSEAFTVHNGWARLIILTLGNPHLLEGAQRRKNGATNPHRVLALRWSNNLDLHRRGRQGGKLLGHALTNTGKHGGATRENNVAVEVLTDVDVTLHDGLESGV